jgi:biopolymer transport protein ExbD
MTVHGLLHFVCPDCQTRLKTNPDNVDSHVPCPGCSADLVVPAPLPGEGSIEMPVAEEAALQLHRSKDRLDNEMDMTPMVDCTFLLLIFFMVTATFALQKSFQIPPPTESQASQNFVESEEDGVITVRIDEYNTFYVSAAAWTDEQEAPNEYELLRKLREAQQADPTVNMLIVEAHIDSSHENVVLAMDIGTELAIDRIVVKSVQDEV